MLNDGTIEHSGGTQNYSTNFIINPDTQMGVCVLTNINSTVNTNMMAENIMNIMEDKATTPYESDIWVTIDTIFSIITFISVPLIVFTLIMLVRIKKRYRKEHRVRKISGKRIAKWLALPILLLILAITMIIVFPITFSSGWLALSAWAPHSMYTGIVSFTLLTILLIATACTVSIYPKK